MVHHRLLERNDRVVVLSNTYFDIWSLLSEYVRKGGIFFLYTMREGHNGIQFYPIWDYNVYIYCKQHKRFVQIPESAGNIAEVGTICVSIESLDLCDKCIIANSAA